MRSYTSSITKHRRVFNIRHSLNGVRRCGYGSKRSQATPNQQNRSQISISRAIQREVNRAIAELDEVIPPQLTPEAQSLFYDDSDYNAWRGLETTGDAMQSILVMEVTMGCIPEAPIGDMKFIANILETNETIHYLVARMRGVDHSLLIGKTAGCALEMIIGMLTRGGGVETARAWYSSYYPPIVQRAYSLYRKLKSQRKTGYYRFSPVCSGSM
ncbi:hypothetical protein Moror_4760 [Moniliophthora roreri MCA 2997]|uniref:Uncharacterized protein n=2 Tax=Moniliophthora roreri TaxID=221103 RepID=V2WZG1_MONRO|nr:hypothetical protein Moror_4760 [Moniliophthora roreri MCA 2997]KAI3615806.1 hypothetical protein WG66_010426 [Moniliophthora roreri]